MNKEQREAALRLADELQRFDGAERESLRDETAALLRELLAAEPAPEPAQKKPSTASQFESVKEAKKVAEAQLSYYRKMMADKSADPVVNQQMTTEPAEPVQEPAAWIHRAQYLLCHPENAAPFDRMLANGWTPMYFRRPTQQHKPLTDEQLKQAMSDAGVRVFQPGLWDVLLDAGRAIERAHGITGEQK